MRNGGWGWIRTHGELAPTPVFKTGSLNRSATHPLRASRSWRGVIPYRRYPQRKRAKLSLVVASAASAWLQFAYFPTTGIHLPASMCTNRQFHAGHDRSGIPTTNEKKVSCCWCGVVGVWLVMNAHMGRQEGFAFRRLGFRNGRGGRGRINREGVKVMKTNRNKANRLRGAGALLRAGAGGTSAMAQDQA